VNVGNWSSASVRWPAPVHRAERERLVNIYQYHARAGIDAVGMRSAAVADDSQPPKAYFPRNLNCTQGSAYVASILTTYVNGVGGLRSR
jgi:hypothetical protein